MQIQIGHLYAQAAPAGQGPVPVTWNPDNLINAHMVVTGDSGSGKTHNLRSFCRQLAQTAGPELERIHIFDTHGDITVGGSHVAFSQSTPWAFNPLELSDDPHHGGVHRAISNFIGMLQRSSRKLGTTQEAVLRALLLDVYAQKGFFADNPHSWTREGGAGKPHDLPEDRIYLAVPFEEKELAKDIARREGSFLQFDNVARCWWTKEYTEGLQRWPVKSWGKEAPTIHDVISLAHLKLKQLWIGTDQKCMLSLENLCRVQAQLHAKVKSTMKRAATEEAEPLQNERDAAADRVREAMEAFLERVTTGVEIEELVRYESSQTLKSLLDRLENLKATGVCRSVPPPLDPQELIWRYELRAYGDDERRMFIENRLRGLFELAMARGEVDGVKTIVIIDEAVRYMVDDNNHIITRIISEARKFGIALFLISQSPTQFPEQILAGVGCKVILGLDPMFHRMAASKLGIEQRFIEAIRPRQLILLNQKIKSQVPKWIAVQLG